MILLMSATLNFFRIRPTVTTDNRCPDFSSISDAATFRGPQCHIQIVLPRILPSKHRIQLHHLRVPATSVDPTRTSSTTPPTHPNDTLKHRRTSHPRNLRDQFRRLPRLHQPHRSDTLFLGRPAIPPNRQPRLTAAAVVCALESWFGPRPRTQDSSCRIPRTTSITHRQRSATVH